MWQTVQFRQRFILASHHFPNSVSRKQTIEWSLFRRYLQLCKKLCKNEKLCILQTWHRICIQLPNVRFCQIWTFSHRFFTFVATVYVGCSAWACQRMFKEQGYLAFLLVLGAFSFFSYGTNGIRNGMAAAVMMLALSFLRNKMDCNPHCSYFHKYTQLHDAPIIFCNSLFVLQ